jgi:hypothetical protein
MKIVLSVLLFAITSSAEGQTTSSIPASKDTLSFREQKAAWARSLARANADAEKDILAFREQLKANRVRANTDAEKNTLLFREQKAGWATSLARANADAEKDILAFREHLKAKRARAKTDAENGPKDRPGDRDAGGNRP